MVVPVMGSAQRYGELVADFSPHRPGLGESQMMRVSGASPANETRLRCHELEMGLVTVPARLADGKLAFLDFAGTGAGLERGRIRRAIINDRLGGDRSRSRWFGHKLDLSGRPLGRLTTSVDARSG